MEEGLKQRLVGAVVLVLLAVVFIPMLLDISTETQETGVDLRSSSDGNTEFSSRIVPLEVAQGESPENAPGQDVEPVDQRASVDGVESQAVNESHDATLPIVSAPDPPEGGESAGLDAGEGKQPDAEAPGAKRSEPVTWAAQLGSFADRRNALVLRNRLRAKGYAAFTESATSDQGEVTRVLVGPEPTRDRTVSTIESLRRDTGLDAFVVRYPRG